VAVIVALASMLVAWRALDQANDARQIALAGGTAATPAGTGSGASAGASTATRSAPAIDATSAAAQVAPTLSGEPPQLTQRTVYTPQYEKQTLTLKASCSSMYADLDEPRANVGSGDYDLMLKGPCGGGTANLVLGNDVSGSQEGAPNMTPQDCGDKIRTAPLGEVPVPVNKGIVLCIATSFAAAQKRGDVRRMVRLEITGVSADGAVTLQLTAWNIPR
jgi:hypothetical protein